MNTPSLFTQAADLLPMFEGTARAFPEGWVETVGPFRIAAASIPIPLFNAAVLTRPTEEDELRDSLELFRAALAHRGVGGLVFAPSAWLAAHDGLYKVNNLTWMGRRLNDDDLVDTESSLAVDKAAATAVAEINAVANGMPAELGSLAYAPGLWREGRVARLLANGETATSGGAVFVEGDLAYVGWMATRPEHQRQGYGGKLFRDLVSDGRRLGASRLSLHATEAGRELYRRFGLVEGEPFSVFYCGEESSGDGARNKR